MSALDKREWARKHQHFESGWWGDCTNTYGEETKQIAYARIMGLDPGPWQAGNAWPVYDLEGRSVLDIGGGPVSMLLKATNRGRALVVDPCTYPTWTARRYREAGIEYNVQPAEEFDSRGWVFDEAWCYNVLQHTIDPERIIGIMRASARRLRIFEWIETEAYLGHPHTLHADELARWCGGQGRTVVLDEVYQELAPGADPSPEMAWRVEQQAWGGSFETGTA